MLAKTKMPAAEAVITLHGQLLDAWNRRSEEDMAALCAPDGIFIGFDGTVMRGPSEIAEALRPIFSDHLTAAYVCVVRRVSFATADVAVLDAVVGMVPPGEREVKPERNAVQTLVAVTREGKWLVTLFQNTPASFDGRPHAREKLTAELNAAARHRGG